MGWRELELFIANGQRIFHTSIWRRALPICCKQLQFSSSHTCVMYSLAICYKQPNFLHPILVWIIRCPFCCKQFQFSSSHTCVMYSLAKHGMKKILLFIANDQRINYRSMGWRDLVLFIANDQRINYTSMGWRELELFIANGQQIVHTFVGDLL
jgi:hypothetical protein